MAIHSISFGPIGILLYGFYGYLAAVTISMWTIVDFKKDLFYMSKKY